jgi:hypothetical protein
MRDLFILLSCVYALTAVAPTKQTIRQIDFANWSYPWVEPRALQSSMEWLKKSDSDEVQLIKGRWTEAEDERGSASDLPKLPFAGSVLESVEFGDVTGDQSEQAIAVLRYDSGGAETLYFVHIYSLKVATRICWAIFTPGIERTMGSIERMRTAETSWLSCSILRNRRAIAAQPVLCAGGIDGATEPLSQLANLSRGRLNRRRACGFRRSEFTNDVGRSGSPVICSP